MYKGRGIDPRYGCWTPGTNGSDEHRGEPLNVAQIAALPNGQEVTITWCGGNGPWRKRVARDALGRVVLVGHEGTPLLPWAHQTNPLHRITLASEGEANHG